jgi:drug/metabolite transporter (DMT)-like permease
MQSIQRQSPPLPEPAKKAAAHSIFKGKWQLPLSCSLSVVSAVLIGVAVVVQDPFIRHNFDEAYSPEFLLYCIPGYAVLLVAWWVTAMSVMRRGYPLSASIVAIIFNVVATAFAVIGSIAVAANP